MYFEMETGSKHLSKLSQHLINIQAHSEMLEALCTDANPDMTAKTYGPLLYNDGIKIRLSNVDLVNERCIAHWKTVCRSYGYNAVIEHNVSCGYVTINCRHRQKFSLLNIAIVALSMLVLVRYLYFS